MEPDFFLPENLKKEREYGQYDPKLVNRENAEKNSSSTGGQEEDFHIPRNTIYSQDIMGLKASKDGKPPSLNGITLIGVFPYQVPLIFDYFEKNNYPPTNDRSNLKKIQDEMVGNWFYLTFNVPVSQIPIIKPVIQINSHFFVGCYLGYYQYENIEPIPLPSKSQEDITSKLYKSNQYDNNVLILENQTILRKFKHFVLGKHELDIPNN